jgi:aminoglycoside phosphotransferase family enzyme
VVQLVRTASRRALADLDAQGRLSPDAFAQVARVSAQVHSDIEELDAEDGDGAIKAYDRLLAWLIERGEENV